MTVVARDVGVVIVAGGSGSRAGGEELKQFRWVAGKPMLLHSLQAFMARPDVCSVVCVLPQSAVADPPPWIFQCDTDRLMLSVGGRTRQESAANGLDDLPDEAQIVLIHDAARPFVTDATIARVIDAVRENPEAGVTAATPVVDSLKEVGADGTIVRSVPREGLWRAQTPQGFGRSLIVRAHADARAAKVSVTDDAALCERIGVPVHVVDGAARAMKITTERDFALAEAWYGVAE
jgi:2-C-methyl-D-erythritol 4-phosphate cytidylyltransferase